MTDYDPEDGSVADAHISSQDSECSSFEDMFPESQAPADTSSGGDLSTLPTGGDVLEAGAGPSAFRRLGEVA